MSIEYYIDFLSRNFYSTSNICIKIKLNANLFDFPYPRENHIKFNHVL